jgi:N-acyl-D-amino-acid deacylase
MVAGFDTVISGGTIFDGARTPRFVSDIGIRDGRIAYIGDIADPGGANVIDARGLNVAPGFIDLHTHYDSQIFWDPYCTISGWHGVTSVVIGNCGFGFAPCKPEDRERCMLTMARNEAVPLKTMQEGMPWDWESFPEFLDSLERTPKGVNIMSYVPLNPLLTYVMGLEAAKTRPATPEERTEIRRLFIEALDAGACGFSAQRKEGNVQRDYDGTPMITDLMAHEDLLLFAEVLRERGEGFMQLLCMPDLAEELASLSGRPVLWNALVAQMDQHGQGTVPQQQVIDWLRDMNMHGLRMIAQSVTCNIGFMFTMEDWNLFDSSPIWRDATIGSHADKLRNLADPEIRRQLREEHDSGSGPMAGGGVRSDERVKARNLPGLEAIFMIGATSERYKPFEGNTIGEIAEKLGKHPIDAFLDMAVEEDLKTEFQSPDIPADTESVRQLVRAPYAVPGLSDGGAHTKFVTSSTYGTEYLIDHVRTGGIVDLEEAHWRLSGYSAYAAGLKDRGTLKVGMPADVIVYDLDALALLPIETTYDFPANEWRRTRKAEGYRFIMVNGEVTFVDGACTGATPGQLLRHGYDSKALEITTLAAE